MGLSTFKPRHAAAAGRSFSGKAKLLDRLYDRHWVAYRARFLAINSRCYKCGVPATIVDHLRPHQGDEKLFKQLDNHIPLCKRCHDTATALYDRRFKAGNSIKNKIEWMAWGRAALDLNFKIKVLPYYGPEQK